jgi:hypothetical protein
MFAIIKDKEFYEDIWEKLISDKFISPLEFNFEFSDTFKPEVLHTQDIHLFFIDEEEGVIGKVTFSHSTRFSESMPFLSIDQPLTDSAIIIKDVDYHINNESHLHNDVKSFEGHTHRFYKDILKNALWICRKLELKNLITLSVNNDDHKDLTFWGDFKFSTYWETPYSVLGIISLPTSNYKQVQESEIFAHSIKLMSHNTHDDKDWSI